MNPRDLAGAINRASAVLLFFDVDPGRDDVPPMRIRVEKVHAKSIVDFARQHGIPEVDAKWHGTELWIEPLAVDDAEGEDDEGPVDLGDGVEYDPEDETLTVPEGVSVTTASRLLAAHLQVDDPRQIRLLYESDGVFLVEVPE